MNPKDLQETAARAAWKAYPKIGPNAESARWSFAHGYREGFDAGLRLALEHERNLEDCRHMDPVDYVPPRRQLTLPVLNLLAALQTYFRAPCQAHLDAIEKAYQSFC